MPQDTGTAFDQAAHSTAVALPVQRSTKSGPFARQGQVIARSFSGHCQVIARQSLGQPGTLYPAGADVRA